MDNLKAVLHLPGRLRFNHTPGLFVKKTIEDTVARDCGYQLPWNPLHATSIGYLFCAILVHFGLISVNFNTIGEIVSVKVVSLLFTTVIVSALCVSLIDPRHYLLRYRVPLHTQIDVDPARYFCHRCNLLREREEVKHCHQCGKCVDGFDHHCFALNHCVGRRNYWIMMVLFNNGLLLTAGLLVAAIIFIYGVAARSHVMRPQYTNSELPFISSTLLCFGRPCKAIFPVIVVSVYIIPTVIVLVSFGALVWAHWSLIAENSSTWQHFKRRRESPEKGESLIMKCLMTNLFSIFVRKRKPKAVEPPPSTDEEPEQNAQTVSKENLLGNMEQQPR